MSRSPLPFSAPRVVQDHERSVPVLTHDHASDLKKLMVAAVMAALSGTAGIIGSHWGGASKDDILELRKDLIAKDVAQSQAVSALWGQVNVLQAKANVIDPSPPADKSKQRRRRAPQPTGDPLE